MDMIELKAKASAVKTQNDDATKALENALPAQTVQEAPIPVSETQPEAVVATETKTETVVATETKPETTPAVQEVKVDPNAPFVVPDRFKANPMIAFLLSLPASPDRETALRGAVNTELQAEARQKELDTLKAEKDEPIRIEAFNAEIKGENSPIKKAVEEALQRHNLSPKTMEGRFIWIGYPNGQFSLNTDKVANATQSLKGTGGGSGSTRKPTEGGAFASKGMYLVDGVEYSSAGACASKLGIKMISTDNSQMALRIARIRDEDASGKEITVKDANGLGITRWHPFYFNITKTEFRQLKDSNGNEKQIPVYTLSKVEDQAIARHINKEGVVVH